MRHDLNKDNRHIVDWALAHGINYFETCYFYLNHQCEEYVYSLLQPYSRESYEICGKLSLSEAFSPWCENYKHMYAEQLNRVPKKYFDVYILQTLRPQAMHPVFATDLLEFFDKEKQKGNIGRFGFSEQCDSQLLRTFLEYPKWDIAQMPLNYYDWYLCDSENNYKLLQEKNIPIIAQAPFKGGELIHGVKHLINDPVQTAMNFVMDKQPEVILTGCSSLSTLQECYKAYNNYQETNIAELERAIELYRSQKIIPCLLCDQCSCPRGIDIPLHFFAYNRALQNKDHFSMVSSLRYFSQDPLNLCVHCGQCMTHCPAHLNIPSYFQDVFNLRP